MTIDDLALATQQEFQNIGERFDRVDGRFDRVEGRLGRMEEVMNTILHAVENIDGRLSAYASRWDDDFSGLDEKVREIDGRLRVVEKRRE